MEEEGTTTEEDTLEEEVEGGVEIMSMTMMEEQSSVVI